MDADRLRVLRDEYGDYDENARLGAVYGTATIGEFLSAINIALAALDAETEATPADVGVEPVVRFKMSARCDWRDEIGHYTTVSETQSETGEWVRYADHATALERVTRERDEARATLDEVCLSSRQEWQRATSAEAKLAEALADRAAQAERMARLEDAAATGTVFEIEHDGFIGEVRGSYVTREGKRGVVLQQIGTRVVHVYGWKWLKLPARASSQEGSDA